MSTGILYLLQLKRQACSPFDVKHACCALSSIAAMDRPACILIYDWQKHCEHYRKKIASCRLQSVWNALEIFKRHTKSFNAFLGVSTGAIRALQHASIGGLLLCGSIVHIGLQRCIEREATTKACCVTHMGCIIWAVTFKNARCNKVAEQHGRYAKE